MPKLPSALVGLAFAAVASATPAAADGYVVNGPGAYGYAPGPALIADAPDGAVIYSYSEVTIRYRAAPPNGYGTAYLTGPPDLWRQREVAYDAIFTRDKRIIYDSTLAAQSRAAAEFYGPRFNGYAPEVVYRKPAYVARRDFGPPPVRVVEPIVVEPAGNCGTYRYWNGTGCIDARYVSRYRNPYKNRFPPLW